MDALAPGDERRQLRVIDIKLTAQPSPGYFAEVALYSMALAGWLIDEGLDRQFVVVPDGAVWPGSHEASNLLKLRREAERKGLQPSADRLRDAIQEDLELVPFQVFALHVRRFLRFDVPRGAFDALVRTGVARRQPLFVLRVPGRRPAR